MAEEPLPDDFDVIVIGTGKYFITSSVVCVLKI